MVERIPANVADSLPLPLARLVRRVRNAKSSLERHSNALYLFEASLKLLASVAIVEYARQAEQDPKIVERLKKLARPALGDWMSFARSLVPALAKRGDEEFRKVDEFIFGQARADCPRAAGLYVRLGELLEERKETRSTVEIRLLFDRLVMHRNRGIGHGAPAAMPERFHEELSEALLDGLLEIWSRCSVTAGRRLIFVPEVREVGGQWLVKRQLLQGRDPLVLPSLELPRAQAASLPHGERLYLELPGAEQVATSVAEVARLRGGATPKSGDFGYTDENGEPSGASRRVMPGLTLLHPLLIYQPDEEEAYFLNGRQGKSRIDYLCYSTGEHRDEPSADAEQRESLRSVLGSSAAMEPVESPSRSEQTDAAEENPTPSPRRYLGDNELLSELGRGGMGIVYRARQLSLKREVALKALNRFGEENEARFRREFRALGRVDHPHVVKVFETGADGNQFFYTMELIEGAPLQSVADGLGNSTNPSTVIDAATWRSEVSTACAKAKSQEKPLSDPGKAPTFSRDAESSERSALRSEDSASQLTTNSSVKAAPAFTSDYVRQIVELARQIADAAHALHEHRVVHRDIKPGNILISADGSLAYLTDLGLAQIADDEEGRLTRTRQFLGTLRYASPEQVLSVGTLDARSDVYSLGATLWELLSLKPMFNASDDTPTAVMMQRIQLDEPGRLRKFNPWVSRDLEAIVSKCLEKKAENRYASARELANDLTNLQENKPVQARPVSSIDRRWRTVKRNPVVSGLLAAVFVLLIAGTVTSTWLAIGLFKALEGEKDALRTQKNIDVERQAMLNDKEEALEREQRTSDDLKIANNNLNSAKDDTERLLAYATLAVADNFYEKADLISAHDRLRTIKEKWRGWEWRFRQRHYDNSYATLHGHTDMVTSVAWSGDGRRLASASSDKTVRIWDAISGQSALELKGHTDIVTSVSWSHDGRRLASASFDKTIRIWNANDGRSTLELKGHLDGVRTAAWSRDGRLASGSKDGAIIIWDAVSGRSILELRGHTDRTHSVAWSGDGQRLASASEDGIRIWDTVSGQSVLELKGSQHSTSVAWSGDGRRLASAGSDQTVHVWDAVTGRGLLELKGHTQAIYSVAWSGDGCRLASASEDKTIRIWDAVGGQSLIELKGHTSEVFSIAWSGDGRRLASTSMDKTIRIWDAGCGQSVLVLRHTNSIESITWSSDGRRLALATWNGDIQIWDSVNDHIVLELNEPTQKATSADWGDHRRFAAEEIARSGMTFQSVGGFVSQEEPAWNYDGRRLASATLDKTIRILDPVSGQCTRELKGHLGHVTSLAWSGDRLASASQDKTIRIWDVTCGLTRLEINGAQAK